MDTDHRDKLYREGKLTDTQYRRAGGVCADEIDDKEYQEDATAETGLPGTTDFGPDDAGHIDASANRRGDQESRARGRMPSARAPTIAEARAASASEFDPNWFRDISGPSRN